MFNIVICKVYAEIIKKDLVRTINNFFCKLVHGRKYKPKGQNYQTSVFDDKTPQTTYTLDPKNYKHFKRTVSTTSVAQNAKTPHKVTQQKLKKLRDNFHLNLQY